MSTNAPPAFNDPDGILETIPDPGPGVSTESLPDPVDTPHRAGAPFEIPETTWRSTRRDALGLGLDPMEAAARLAALNRDPRGDKYQPRETPPPPPPPDPEAERLDRLRYLARWVGPTANSRAMVERVEVALAENRAAGKPKRVIDGLLADLATWQQRQDDALERDAIQATRPPGCRCLGAGAVGSPSNLTVSEPGDPTQGIPPRVLYSEGTNGPLVYGDICDACPEGLAYREHVARELRAMRDRMAQTRVSRLLGSARIPDRLKHLTLETYPYPAMAQKAWRWYATNARERDEGVPVYGLRPFLLMSGPNRRGKTGVTIGVLKRAISRGHPAVFRTVPDLLDDLRAAYDEANPNCFADILAALKAAPLLILDDLGAEKLTDWVADVLYRLTDHRANENLLTIFTTNLNWRPGADDGPSELARWLGMRLYMRVRPNANLLDFGEIPILNLDADPEPVQVSPADTFEEW